MENNQKQLAEKAYRLCKTSTEKGDYDLARIYILNAITHDARMEYFDELIDIVKKTSPDVQRRNVAEQTLNILSMALLQNDPDQVIKIQAMMDELQIVCDDTFDSNPAEQESESELISSFADLEKHSWKTLKKAGKLKKMEVIQEKTDFIQQILNSERLSGEQKKTAERELLESASYYEYLSKEKALNETLEEIKNEIKTKIEGRNLFFLAAKLQNASGIMAQMWLLDVSAVLDSRPVLTQYAETIQKYEKEYNKIRSHHLWLELKEKAMDVEKEIRSGSPDKSGTPMPDKNLTKKLKRIQECIQEISGRLYELTDPEAIQDINRKIRELGKKVEEISQQRFAAYQGYVAEKCKEAISDYDDKTHVSEKNALNFLEDYHFAEIDESLLSPEAASIFHEAKGLFLNKLGVVKKAEFQVKCVISEKKKLEDF